MFWPTAGFEEKTNFDGSGFSEEETLISACAVAQCWTARVKHLSRFVSRFMEVIAAPPSDRINFVILMVELSAMVINEFCTLVESHHCLLRLTVLRTFRQTFVQT